MKRSIFRRFIAVSAAAFSFASASAFTVAAADNGAYTPEDKEVTSFSDGILTYNVIDDSRFVEVTQCTSTAANVNIMPKIDGYTITSIAEGAFAGCQNLQSVTLPQNAELTSIGAYAFAECSSLKSVTLPNTVKDIPVGMFAYCTSLESVTFGSETVSIGDEAFRECSSLKEIVLPETLTDMGNLVFYMCTSLESVEIPESITALGGYDFAHCVSLEDFYISASLESLGDAPFMGCTNLTNITVDENNPSYTVNDGVLYSKDETILYFYPPAREDKSFTVPDGVVDIYDGSFFRCENLQEVIFPDSLTTIGLGAFDFCSSLNYARIPESVTNIMSTAFADCDSLESVTFVGADNETDGEGEDLVIGDHAFYADEKLMEVILPKRVVDIGEDAFGVTEIVDESSNTIPMAVEGFMLRGFDSAERYIRNCDVSVGFSPRNFPWKKIVFWVCAGGALIAIAFISVIIVRKNMMTPEEREALRQAKEERAKHVEDEETTEDDGYKSIIGDDEGDSEEKTENKTDATEELNHFRSASPARLHQIGHTDEEE